MMRKVSQSTIKISLLACLVVSSACSSVKETNPATRFIREHPGYKLTEVPLLTIEQEAYYRYKGRSIDIAWIRRSAEEMSKEDFLKQLDRREKMYLRLYESVKEEVAEIERLTAEGAKVYWYSFEGANHDEEGYIVLTPDGEVLKETHL